MFSKILLLVLTLITSISNKPIHPRMLYLQAVSEHGLTKYIEGDRNSKLSKVLLEDISSGVIYEMTSEFKEENFGIDGPGFSYEYLYTNSTFEDDYARHLFGKTHNYVKNSEALLSSDNIKITPTIYWNCSLSAIIYVENAEQQKEAYNKWALEYLDFLEHLDTDDFMKEFFVVFAKKTELDTINTQQDTLILLENEEDKQLFEVFGYMESKNRDFSDNLTELINKYGRSNIDYWLSLYADVRFSDTIKNSKKSLTEISKEFIKDNEFPAEMFFEQHIYRAKKHAGSIAALYITDENENIAEKVVWAAKWMEKISGADIDKILEEPWIGVFNSTQCIGWIDGRTNSFTENLEELKARYGEEYIEDYIDRAINNFPSNINE